MQCILAFFFNSNYEVFCRNNTKYENNGIIYSFLILEADCCDVYFLFLSVNYLKVPSNISQQQIIKVPFNQQYLKKKSFHRKIKI